MGDWLEGNKMRTQSALQARQMANQTQQKGFENMMTSMGTVQKSFEPAALKNLEVEKERELYGPDGIRTGYETGQKELQAKIASEANIKSFEAAYPGTPAFEGEGDNKKPSRAYMMYTFGFDPQLQWGRYYMDKDKQYGQMTDVLRSSFNYIRDQMGPSIVVDPETGKLQGLDGKRKKAFIDHLTQNLWNNNNRGRWGIETWEQAKQKATEWVNGAVWTGMDTAGADLQSDYKELRKFSINPDIYERGPSQSTGDPRQIQYDQIIRKKIAAMSNMINQAPNYIKDDAILNDILELGNTVKTGLHNDKSTGRREKRVQDTALLITNKYLNYMNTLDEAERDPAFMEGLNQTAQDIKDNTWVFAPGKTFKPAPKFKGESFRTLGGNVDPNQNDINTYAQGFGVGESNIPQGVSKDVVDEAVLEAIKEVAPNINATNAGSAYAYFASQYGSRNKTKAKLYRDAFDKALKAIINRVYQKKDKPVVQNIPKTNTVPKRNTIDLGSNPSFKLF